VHPAGVLFFDRVRDVSAGDGVHTYSCVRYATLPSVCTDYARSVSQADETGFYAPSVAHNALPRRPWRCISVLHEHNPTDAKQLRYALSQEYVCTPSPALTSLTLWQNVWGDVCAPVAGAYVLLRCGEIGVTCAHRWPVLTSCYVVKRCEMMCCTTYRYLYFLWESEVCGRGGGYTVS
jgi:hypothetical protein